ncbi:MAG: hypothetical protein L3J20_04890, partial [Flavobacteriaceae bacterium]|nr:hypothetical protein [Flavobacteriaceae bacterium]
ATKEVIILSKNHLNLENPNLFVTNLNEEFDQKIAHSKECVRNVMLIHNVKNIYNNRKIRS